MKKKILMISTGGTIASSAGDSGLAPAITSEGLLARVPRVSSICDVDAIQLMSLDSTNIGPEHWLKISCAVEENYDKYDGFVITHGTDTLAYTAAALSYLIQDSPKPIVLTGAQKPIELEDTDARQNLLASFIYAADDLSRDVSIVFDGKVIIGTRARKERTKSYNAFASVDYPEIAIIRDGKLIRYITPKLPEKAAIAENTGSQWDGTVEARRAVSGPVFYHRLSSKVLLATLIPGMDADVLYKLRDDYDAVIFQSFGSGGLPGGSDGEFAHAARFFLDAGKTIVMMTQVPYEGSDMSVYQVGKSIKENLPVIEAHDMTMEAVVTKLMWILGETKDPAAIKEMFYTPVQHDIIM